MEKFILPFRPKTYPYGGNSNCGVLTAKTILSSYGYDIGEDPNAYHPNKFAKITGWTLPGMLKRILNKNGLPVEIKFTRASAEEKIHLLKSLVQEGQPIVLMIGSISPKKIATFPPWAQFVPRVLSKIVLHWITIWGFDDERRVFYVYDSSVPVGKADSVPIGNRAITYKKTVTSWNAGLLTGTLTLCGFGPLYISKK